MTDQTLTDDEVAVAAEAGDEATETDAVDDTEPVDVLRVPDLLAARPDDSPIPDALP